VRRYIRALTKLAEVLSASLPAFGAIAMLMFLFMIVFSIIGLQVFGQAQLDIGFPNFHSFFGSLLIVFQLMTLEDWQTLMLTTVRATNWGSCLYFIFWIILSKYVLQMLFLAVVMEAFERSYEELNEEETLSTLQTSDAGSTGALGVERGESRAGEGCPVSLAHGPLIALSWPNHPTLTHKTSHTTSSPTLPTLTLPPSTLRTPLCVQTRDSADRRPALTSPWASSQPCPG